MAENDEDVIITKHGNPYVVMISLKKYKELHTAHRPDFISELKKWREKNKDLLSNADSQIASIALANNMILVTRNTKDFEPIQKEFSLCVVNWFEE